MRFGRVVFDDEVLRRGLRTIAERRPWPDAERKRVHASKSLGLAKRVVATGDQDGALVQVRTALSLAARAFLLAHAEFPLSRAELPDQLASAGHATAARYLRSTIEDSPRLRELATAVDVAQELLDERPRSARGVSAHFTPRAAATMSRTLSPEQQKRPREAGAEGS